MFIALIHSAVSNEVLILLKDCQIYELCFKTLTYVSVSNNAFIYPKNWAEMKI